jgi:glycosyltransferase involved in cell wall biosynthesis
MMMTEHTETPVPTLSVTVTNYNYGRFLGRNIESILAQSFADFELILVDNASTDDSVAVMRKYAASDPRIRIVAHARNEGQFASYREASDLCRGRYRVHMDGDDWVLSNDAFRLQVDLLNRHPDMGLVFSALTMVDCEGSELFVSHPFPRDGVFTSDEAFEGLISFALMHSGLMLRLDAYRATTGYADAYPHMADQLLAVRISEQARLVGYFDRSLYAFRQHGNNLNLRPQMKVVKEEVLPALQSAFDGPVGQRQAPAVRRRMVRRSLVHLPTRYIFGGQLNTGWLLYWESVKVRPFSTLFQRRTLSLVARTLLGDRGFHALATSLGWGYDAGKLARVTLQEPYAGRTQVNR